MPKSKTEKIELRLTPEEKREIEIAAFAAGKTVSNYMRDQMVPYSKLLNLYKTGVIDKKTVESINANSTSQVLSSIKPHEPDETEN